MLSLVDMEFQQIGVQISGDVPNAFHIKATPESPNELCAIRSCFGGPNDTFIISGSQSKLFED